MKKIVSFILIFIIVFSFSGCSYFFSSKLDASKAVEIECPSFIGMTLEEVQQHELFTDNIFEFELEYTYNDEYDIGFVCDQSFNEGKKLKMGDRITLYISKGKKTVAVPDVRGRTEMYAITELKSKGFTVVIKEIASDDAEKGFVIETEPKHGTYWAEGAEITVYISLGRLE